MPYELEDLTGREPARLVSEHHRMVQWIKDFPRRGVLQYLERRYVHAEEGLVLYYIDGLGMTEGQSFALVRGVDVVAFDVWRESPDGSTASVSHIAVPERMLWSRAEVLKLIEASFTSYVQLDSIAAFPFMNRCSISFEKVAWEILPRKYSALYFRQQCRLRWQQLKPRAGRLKDHLISPLIALLLLGLACASQPLPAWGGWQRVPMLVAVAWVISRFLTYDRDLKLGPWLVGLQDWRNPMKAIAEALGRITESRPLELLVATLDLSALERSAVTLSITNKTAWPIRYVGVQSATLAELLAPGTVAAVRAGQLDRKVVEQRYPPRSRRWLLPYQSVRWTMLARTETVPAEGPSRLDVTVMVTRFATGERRTRPGAYSIPMSTRR